MSDVKTLLPPNADKGLRDVEQTAAIHITSPEAIRNLWNPSTCDERFLPWLAWAFSVETWDHKWPLETRRRVVAEAISIHRIKGTPAAVKRALATLDFSTDLSEWFEHGGDPHTFRIDAFGEDVFEAGYALDGVLFNQVADLIENVKPARSHFELRIGESFSGDVYLRAGAQPAYRDDVLRDAQPRTTVAQPPSSMRAGARLIIVEDTHHDPAVRPRRAPATSHVRTGARAAFVSRWTHDFERKAA